MNRTQWAMLLSLAVVWGGSFFFIGAALREMPPFSVIAARLVFAAAALNIALFAARAVFPLAMWRDFAVMGLLNNAIPFSLIAWGQTQIAGGLAAILNATTPLFTIVVAHFLAHGERMSAGKIFGVCAGIAGAAVIVGAEALRGLGANAFAQLAILGAACSYAFASVFGLRFRRMKISPLATAAGQVSASALILLPLAALTERVWTLPAPGIATWGALAGLGLLSTALAYLLYFRILASAGATNVALVTFLAPISAILLGALFLGEVLEIKHFYGMGLIGIGLAAIDGRIWRRLRQTFQNHGKIFSDSDGGK